ncbi:MAG: 1-deoxy-D-xylulose-5-phosphate reductoisomerase [Bacteroidia bacterium]
MRLVILGGGGSIGRQALSLLCQEPHRYELVGVALHQNTDTLAQWLSLKPQWIAFTDPQVYKAHKATLPLPVLSEKELLQAITASDRVLNAIVGFAGFRYTWHALQAGKIVALANKESLVVGGKLLKPWMAQIYPVDSEHSAIWQCLQGEKPHAIQRVYLTASGGPFRNQKRSQLQNITPENALRHPTWQMGKKISIDSATLMNKALELIEAHWLFDLPPEKLGVWIHPQSIVHAVITFCDGSMKAQLSIPDMRLPIRYALDYPERLPDGRCPWLSLPQIGALTFEEPDTETFPSLGYAQEAMTKGTSYACVLNAANEVAVEKFLAQKIGFWDIFTHIEKALHRFGDTPSPETIEALEELDRHTRAYTRAL